MYKQELASAQDIARKAGEIMRRYFDGDQQREKKSDGTPVTVADTTINSMVIDALSQDFPGDIVIGEEESTGGYGSGRRWFCDPIDGTKAFTWGVPTAMFSLGLVVDGQPVLGVCYEPMLDQLYFATIGGGAYRNDVQIHVNDQTLENGILGTISSQYRLRRHAPYVDALLDHPSRIDMAAFSGAVAKVVRIAEGRFVGYIEELVNPHDMAACQVILTEAGGRVTDMQGNAYNYTKPFKGTIASNGLVHGELVTICQSSI